MSYTEDNLRARELLRRMNGGDLVAREQFAEWLWDAVQQVVCTRFETQQDWDHLTGIGFDIAFESAAKFDSDCPASVRWFLAYVVGYRAILQYIAAENRRREILVGLLSTSDVMGFRSITSGDDYEVMAESMMREARRRYADDPIKVEILKMRTFGDTLTVIGDRLGITAPAVFGHVRSMEKWVRRWVRQWQSRRDIAMEGIC